MYRRPRSQLSRYERSDDVLLDVGMGTGARRCGSARGWRPGVPSGSTCRRGDRLIDAGAVRSPRASTTSSSASATSSEPLPFADGRVHRIVCSSAFHHFPKQLDTIAEMFRCCARRPACDRRCQPALSPRVRARRSALRRLQLSHFGTAPRDAAEASSAGSRAPRVSLARRSARSGAGASRSSVPAGESRPRERNRLDTDRDRSSSATTTRAGRTCTPSTLRACARRWTVCRDVGSTRSLAADHRLVSRCLTRELVTSRSEVGGTPVYPRAERSSIAWPTTGRIHVFSAAVRRRSGRGVRDWSGLLEASCTCRKRELAARDWKYSSSTRSKRVDQIMARAMADQERSQLPDPPADGRINELPAAGGRRGPW